MSDTAMYEPGTSNTKSGARDLPRMCSVIGIDRQNLASRKNGIPCAVRNLPSINSPLPVRTVQAARSADIVRSTNSSDLRLSSLGSAAFTKYSGSPTLRRFLNFFNIARQFRNGPWPGGLGKASEYPKREGPPIGGPLNLLTAQSVAVTCPCPCRRSRPAWCRRASCRPWCRRPKSPHRRRSWPFPLRSCPSSCGRTCPG